MTNLSPEYFFDLKNFKHASLFHGCKYPWQALAKLKAFFAGMTLGQIECEIPPGVHLEHPESISIGKGSVVEPGAFIRGPCVIGENCEVRQGAYIRGNFVAGDGCVIGHDTEVKNTIFLNDVRAGHFAYLGDSILGNEVNLGAGTICANLRLDHGKIFINTDEEKIITGLSKLGAILGDGVQTGCNSVLNPGTVLGKQTICYPCTNIGGYIPAKQVVRTNSQIVVTPFSKFS